MRPPVCAAGARGVRGGGARDRQQQLAFRGLEEPVDHDDDEAGRQEAAAHLHRQAGGRPVADLDQDGRSARADPAAQPRCRRAVPARRPEAQARAVRSRAFLVAVVSAAALVPCAAARAAPPPISAPEAILVEPQTQDVVLARRATVRRPIASTTKLMTALIALERRRLTDIVTAAPYAAIPGESLMGLREGEPLTVADLLRGLLMVSANDAAVTLALDVSGSKRAFVALMNRRARALGLRDTHYAKPGVG